MKMYKVIASSMSGTYNAGTFTATSKQDAVQQAREHYRNSDMGRMMKDVGRFTFHATEVRE